MDGLAGRREGSEEEVDRFSWKCGFNGGMSLDSLHRTFSRKDKKLDPIAMKRISTLLRNFTADFARELNPH
jgi:hypothetical protein